MEHLASIKKFLLLSAVFTASAVQAQEQQADTLSGKKLDEVVVTATRSAVARSKTPQSVTVITGRDMALTPAQEFTDILKKNSSINIIQYPGLLAGVGIRGFRPQTGGLNQRSLLLVDGRPAGTANLATINPANIERIEVLKGPASALYGSQAMGGVINIITKKTTGAIRSNVFAEFGSYQTFKAGGTAGGNITDKVDFDLSFTTFDRNKNMKLGEGNLFRNMFDAGSATKFYRDSTRQTEDKRSDGLKRDFTKLNYNTASARLGYQLSRNWRVDVKGERFVAKNVESPSDIFFGNQQPSTKDIERNNGELSISGNLSNHQLSLRGYLAGENNFNNTLVSGGVRILPYLSFQSNAQWKGIQLKDIYKLKNHSLIFGIDHNSASTTSRAYNSNTTERAPFSPNYSILSTGAYVQGQFNFLGDKLVINPGARYDIITYDVKKTPLLNTYAPGKETNPFFTPSLAAQYTFLNLLTVHSTIGRAFVTPDAYNVAGYSEIIASNKATVTKGNPDLKNESSTSWDMGLRINKSGSPFSADITYFNTNVKDRITTRRTTPTTTETTESGYVISSRTTYINANKANISGLEAEAAYDFGAVSLYANATKTFKAEEVTIAATGAQTTRDIYNVADFTGNFGVEYNKLKHLSFRLNSRYTGNRKDTDFNDPMFPEIEYPEFMVVDLGAAYKFAQKHTISLLINNITDENYYEKRGFNLQGRNLSVRYGLSL